MSSGGRGAMSAEITGAERRRLEEARRGVPWRRWGPYLAERAWGTVREDYSASGDAWRSFTHDDARRRAYRWNEDGLLGISDDEQRLCLALCLWNEKDPILKERLFGLSNPEGNHGEDVKELYFYLDAVPSFAYHTPGRRRHDGRSPRRARHTERRPAGRGRPPASGAARHRRLRWGPLLRRRRGVRQGGTGRGPHADPGHEPGPGSRAPPRHAHRLVP